MLSTNPSKRFVPISRFGVGVLSVFLIGDVVEVITKNPRSPRADTIRRKVRMDGSAGLAFVTEDSEGQQGTTVRVRLKDTFATQNWMSVLTSYIQQVVVRPKWTIELDFPGQKTLVEAQPFFRLSEESRGELSARNIEPILLDVGRWSDRLRGSIALLLARQEDGSLSHKLENKLLRFSSREAKVDPFVLFEGYQRNRVTVNGFVMALSHASRIFGRTKEARIAFDLDVVGDSEIAYNVARERIVHGGAALVKQEMGAALLKGLNELGIFESMTPQTQAAFSPPLSRAQWIAQAGGPIEDQVLLGKVRALMPEKGWIRGLPAEIAEKLGISRDTARLAIYTLLEKGRVEKPS